MRGGAAASLVAVLLTGCALRAPRPLQPTSPAALLESLAARRAAVTSLRARARLRAGLEGVWTREAVLVRRPDAVRIDVLTPFGLALAIGARGEVLWAYPPSEGTRYEGPATPENLTRFLGAPIRVEDVVDVLLGMPPRRTPVGASVLAVTDGREYRLTVPIAEGIQTIWFAGDTLLVTRAEERRAGAAVLQVGFGDYRDGFPHLLDVSAPGRGTTVKVAYDVVEPNAPVEPALFAPPPAPRTMPLDAAAARTR
jgi:hypothetical protein